MNKFLKLPAIALMALSLAACGGDDPDDGGNGGNGGETPSQSENSGESEGLTQPAPITPYPAEIFPNGMPTSIEGLKFEINDKGLLTSMTSRDLILKFTYELVNYDNRTFDATISVTDLEDPSEDETFYVDLDNRGFIRYAIEKYDNGDEPDEYEFRYDGDSHLTFVRRSEDNETFKLTYTDGDITSVSRDEYSETNVYTIHYTDDVTATPIANKGALMFFDECFSVDLDFIGYAYYAGMLGKATKHLPVRCDKSDDTEYNTFSWTLDSNAMPTHLNVYLNRPNVAPSLDNSISIVW